MTERNVYRTIKGKRYLVLGSSCGRSDMVELRDEYKAAIRKKLPKSEIRIEPRSKPGHRDTWELLVEVEG